MKRPYSKAECYFDTVDNEDHTFWISVSPQGQDLIVDDVRISIGLHLDPHVSMEDADALAALLGKRVVAVSVSRDSSPPK